MRKLTSQIVVGHAFDEILYRGRGTKDNESGFAVYSRPGG